MAALDPQVSASDRPLLHEDAKIQLIATTHSPLILASAEPLFDPVRDAQFDLDLVDGLMELQKRPFEQRGTTAGRPVVEKLIQ